MLMADEDGAAIESIEKVEGSQEQEPALVDGEAAFDEQFPGYRREPVPVVETSNFYNLFGQNYGADEAAVLQRVYGDHAVEKNHIVASVFRDHPEFDDIYEECATEGGGISGAGMEKIIGKLLKESPHRTVESLERRVPELFAIIDDHYDETTDTVSAAGVHRAIAYIGERSGYRYTYRGKK